MTEIRRDYSNTVFYKIHCKDPNVTDVYIGHTTDFVKRKSRHEYVCNSPKHPESSCKLYNAIRANEGWKNWSMDIIAFHKCEDLTEARKYEQEYFEKYIGTLNSVDPLPSRRRQSKRIQREHQLQETSSDTLREAPLEKTNDCKKYVCEKCDFTCSKASNFNTHLLTRKHKIAQCGIVQCERLFTCLCGKSYRFSQGLSRHKRTCKTVIQEKEKNDIDLKGMFLESIQESKKLRNVLITQQEQMSIQQQQITEMITKVGNT